MNTRRWSATVLAQRCPRCLTRSLPVVATDSFSSHPLRLLTRKMHPTLLWI